MTDKCEYYCYVYYYENVYQEGIPQNNGALILPRKRKLNFPLSETSLFKHLLLYDMNFRSCNMLDVTVRQLGQNPGFST